MCDNCHSTIINLCLMYLYIYIYYYLAFIKRKNYSISTLNVKIYNNGYSNENYLIVVYIISTYIHI